MICVSVFDKNKINKALSKADLVELRLDKIKSPKLEKIITKKNRKRLIITDRKGRINLIKKAIDLGVGYVDIEYDIKKEIIKDIIKNKKKTKVIVSYHNFKKTPNLNPIYNKIKSLNPDIIKIVPYANKISDNIKVKKLLENKTEVILFCMGNKGIPSRILSLLWGSYLTFTSIDDKSKTASGQITIDEATDRYKVKKLNKNTKILGIIGNPVMHSKGKLVNNKILKNQNYVHIPFEVNNVREFFKLIKELNFKGISVTLPHKQNVIPFLDKIDKAAKKIGAVNTIVKNNNKLIGYNTDYIGVKKSLEKTTKIKNKKAIVLGAGGAARAVIYALKLLGARITILNRTTSKAKALAKEFNCNYENLKNLKNLNFNILINSTSVGMEPDINKSLVPKNLLKKQNSLWLSLYTTHD